MFSYLYFVLSAIISYVVTYKRGYIGKWYSIPVIIGVWILVYAFFFLLHLGIFMLFGLTINTKKLPNSIHNIYRKIGFDIMKVLLDTLKVKVKMTGLDMMPKEPYMFVCNHKSAFDPMISLIKFKKYDLAFVSKKENLNIPFVGRYMYAVGCLSLDRENAKSAMTSIKKASDYIKQGKVNIGIYPEGKVNPDGKELLPFKKGSYKIAKNAEVPIVVASIRGTEKIRKNFFKFKRTYVYIDVLGVVSKDDVMNKSTGELAEITRDMIAKNLDPYYNIP